MFLALGWWVGQLWPNTAVYSIKRMSHYGAKCNASAVRFYGGDAHFLAIARGLVDLTLSELTKHAEDGRSPAEGETKRRAFYAPDISVKAPRTSSSRRPRTLCGNPGPDKTCGRRDRVSARCAPRPRKRAGVRAHSGRRRRA